MSHGVHGWRALRGALISAMPRDAAERARLAFEASLATLRTLEVLALPLRECLLVIRERRGRSERSDRWARTRAATRASRPARVTPACRRGLERAADVDGQRGVVGKGGRLGEGRHTRLEIAFQPRAEALEPEVFGVILEEAMGRTPLAEGCRRADILQHAARALRKQIRRNEGRCVFCGDDRHVYEDCRLAPKVTVALLDIDSESKNGKQAEE